MFRNENKLGGQYLPGEIIGINILPDAFHDRPGYSDTLHRVADNQPVQAVIEVGRVIVVECRRIVRCVPLADLCLIGIEVHADKMGTDFHDV